MKATTAALCIVLSIFIADMADAEPDNTIETVTVIGERTPEDVVSTTRFETSVYDVPRSLQIISREIIDELGALGIDEIIDKVASVQTFGNNDGRGLSVNIRGFNDAPVLRDGFRFYGNDSLEPEIETLERIEIIKGPASIFFGQAQPGGLVNFVSKKPQAEPYRALTLKAGERGLLGASLDLTGSVFDTETLSHRFIAVYREEDSFRNLDDNYDRFFLAPSLAWDISGETRLTLFAEFSEADNPADFGTLAVGKGIADIPAERVTNNPNDLIEKEYWRFGYSLDHDLSNNWLVKNQFSVVHDRYGYSVLTLPLFFDDDPDSPDFGNLTRVFAAQFNDAKITAFNTSVQGQFNTGRIEHSLVIGLDLSREEAEINTRFDPSPQFFSTIDIFSQDPGYFDVPLPDFSTIPISSGSDSESDRAGFFVQHQLHFSDSLIASLSARYDSVEREGEEIVTQTLSKQDDDSWTPSIGLLFKPKTNTSLYASYSRSFEPNFFDQNANGDFFDPQEGEGVEMGIKYALLDGLFTTTLAIFDITRSNLTTTDPNNPLASIDAGEQTSRGLEIDVNGQLTDNWTLLASYAYIDGEVSKDNPDASGASNEGNKIPAPEHSTSLWTTYEFTDGAFDGLGLGLGLEYVDEVFGNVSNDFSADSYIVSDAAIYFQTNRWKATVNIKNLFDEEYVIVGNSSRTRGIYPGEPRTVSGDIRFLF